MYLGGNGGNDINKYTLPTAWDVSTIIMLPVIQLAAQTVSYEGFNIYS